MLPQGEKKKTKTFKETSLGCKNCASYFFKEISRTEGFLISGICGDAQAGLWWVLGTGALVSPSELLYPDNIS